MEAPHAKPSSTQEHNLNAGGLRSVKTVQTTTAVSVTTTENTLPPLNE